MKTWNAKKDEVSRHWWLLNASEQSLGRLATQVAILLRGKHKVEFTPHIDTGDFVVVINASQVQLTGKKWTNKKYYSHSGFFGSLKTKKANDFSGSQLINRVVSGMLPKNKMRRKLMKKLKVYESAEHPHQSQKPSAFSLDVLLKRLLSDQEERKKVKEEEAKKKQKALRRKQSKAKEKKEGSKAQRQKTKEKEKTPAKQKDNTQKEQKLSTKQMKKDKQKTKTS